VNLPWTLQQLHQVRDETDPEGRRRGPQVAHGTMTRSEGSGCTRCHQAQNDAARARFRRKAQARLPVEVRKQLLDAIYNGKPARTVIRDLGLSSNQVWGLTKTDHAWSENWRPPLTATRRADLEHGTNAAYVHLLCLRGAPGAPAHPDDSESETAERHLIVLCRTRGWPQRMKGLRPWSCVQSNSPGEREGGDGFALAGAAGGSGFPPWSIIRRGRNVR
jgi:hypothetical protein